MWVKRPRSGIDLQMKIEARQCNTSTKTTNKHHKKIQRYRHKQKIWQTNYMWFRIWIWRLQLLLSLIKYLERCHSHMSILICFSYVFLGLSQLLFPSTVMFPTLLIGAYMVFLCICQKAQNYLNLLSCVFVVMGAISSFSAKLVPNLFILVRPHICLNICISDTFIFNSDI